MKHPIPLPIPLNDKPSIKNLPAMERPRERCLSAGAHSLSLRECLALILNSGPPGAGAIGLAQRILDRAGVGMTSSEQEQAFFASMEIAGSSLLQDLPGIGDAARARVLAAFEIGRRYSNHRRRAVRDSQSLRSRKGLERMALERVHCDLRNQPEEWLGFVPLHASGKLGELCLVEKGVRTHVNVEPAELFARVLCLRPQGFFLFHNHPSGDPTPSDADVDLTWKVEQVCRRLNLKLFGHWVVSSHGERWISGSTASSNVGSVL